MSLAALPSPRLSNQIGSIETDTLVSVIKIKPKKRVLRDTNGV